MADTARQELIEKCRMALRRSDTHFDSEIGDAIDASLKDMGIAGITNLAETDPLVIKAIKVYVKMDSGDFDDEYDKLKASYDELKAEMGMNHEYTSFGGTDETLSTD